MDKKRKWNIYFKMHDCPCFITEKQTDKLLYCNNLFLNQFKIKGKPEDIVGQDLNDIPELQFLKLSKKRPTFQDFDYFESEITDTNSNTKLLLRSILSPDDDTIFSEILPIGDIIEYKYEEAMAKCLAILQLNKTDVIPALMKLLSDFYDSKSAFINRINYENKEIYCDYDMISKPELEVASFDKVLENSDILFKWVDTRDESGIIEININNDNLTPISKTILTNFKLNNLVACVVEDNKNVPYTVVGLSECKEEFWDLRFLKAVSNFITQGFDKAEMEKSITSLKNVDDLTGFFSRTIYSKKVEEIIKTPPKSIGIVFVNINGLKIVNEQFGYTKGDKYIKLASQKLKTHFDFDFYRISGDEFIGIAENIDKAKFDNDITKLQNTMRDTKDYTFAIGFAFGQNSFDYTKLTIEAETIMYINKQEYYANSDRTTDDVSDNILANLLSYLKNDEFMIYLQPQVNLKDSSLHGAEALIRRYDKTNEKMVFPDEFIPLYEQKSIIRHVDMFVVEEVCKLLADWDKSNKAIPISVNLSRVTLQEFGIVDSIIEICDRYKVPHNLLVIEVTERVGLVENNVASSLIKSFKDNNFNISLDDFGCAYSNIVTLAQIQVDEVKIDKSLVDDLIISKKNHILVKNVLSMCNELEGASTLAEGIENEAQAKLLYELGCGLGQGYLFSRPIPVPEFISKYINV